MTITSACWAILRLGMKIHAYGKLCCNAAALDAVSQLKLN
jgi:hypothetical protein